MGMTDVENSHQFPDIDAENETIGVKFGAYFLEKLLIERLAEFR